jgi:LemA protein
VGRLFALAEDYPDLQANANFQGFFDQLVDTEDRIALARAYYNDSLLSLKNRLRTFPDVLVAKIFRFNPGKPLPSLTEKASEVPEISLHEDEEA